MLSVKFRGLIPELCLKLLVLSLEGGDGIFGVGVKFVEIRKNINGEGKFLVDD